MHEEEVTLTTQDGECVSYVFSPGDGGEHPAVIFYMDGLGIRPALLDMGRRLAAHGYVVLLPDLYYRAGPYTPMSPKELFASGDIVGALVDGESTLKRLVFNRGKPVLLAENPRYRPIAATEELLIQGVYVGHIRVHR